jgi:hypothetical protein
VRSLAIVAALSMAALACVPAAQARQKQGQKQARSSSPQVLRVSEKQLKPKARKGQDQKQKSPRSKLNMPKGWQWPPTVEMQIEGRRCMDDLDRLKVKWKPAPKQGRIVTPVYVTDMKFAGVQLKHRYEKGPYVMDCALARAWARDAGPALAQLGVVEVRHGQIFKLRDVAGKKGVLSRHSLGLAIDVYAFVTEDGTVHDVLGDYTWGDDILLEIEARVTDTRAFRTLLTPGNDPARHYDHFHVEARAAGDAVVSKPTRQKMDTEADDDVIVDVPPALEPAPSPERVRAEKKSVAPVNARERKGTN